MKPALQTRGICVIYYTRFTIIEVTIRKELFPEVSADVTWRQNSEWGRHMFHTMWLIGDRAVCSTIWIEVPEVALLPSRCSSSRLVSNLFVAKHREMWRLFSHGDISSYIKTSNAGIILSGLASPYFSHVDLFQRSNIYKAFIIIENLYQKLCWAVDLHSNAFLILFCVLISDMYK
jgi:hypothetical protein